MNLKPIGLCLICLFLITACSRQEEPALPSAHISPLLANDISNHNVQAIVEDENGQIWLGTFRGLNRYDGHQYYQYYYAEDSTGVPDNNIQDMLIDRKKRMWLATSNGVCIQSALDNFPRVPLDSNDNSCSYLLESADGTVYTATASSVYTYDEQQRRFVTVVRHEQIHNQRIQKILADPGNRLWILTVNAIYGFSKQGKCFYSQKFGSETDINFSFADSYIDDKGLLWMGSMKGLMLFDTHTLRFSPLPAALEKASAEKLLWHILCIYPYAEKQILISSDAGLFLYDEEKQTLYDRNDAAFPFKAAPFSPRVIFIDSKKNVWMGSNEESFCVGYNKSRKFNKVNKFADKFGKQPITSVAVDKKQNIWIATKKNGIVAYNTLTQEAKEVASPRTSAAKPYYLFVDSQDHLWETTVEGITEYAYDGSSLHLLRHQEAGLMLCAAEDSKGTVWFAGNGSSIYAFPRDEAAYEVLPVFSASTPFISALLTLKDGNLVAGGYVDGLKQINPQDRQVTAFPIADADLQQFIKRPRFIPTSLFQDSTGDIWIGMVGNGLLHYDIRTHQLQKIDNITCSDVSSFEEDKLGNVWISTMYGLNKFDRSVGEIIQYFEADGLGGNQFFDRASCKLADGTLVFGGTHGITMFNPADITETDSIPIIFQSLRVNNQLVKPREGGIIDKRIDKRPDIHLSHQQNNFTIGYSDVGYSEFENVHFYYKLECIDKMWVDARTNHEATYSSLPAGHYTFRVKIAENLKQKPLSETSIEVFVHPAPWNSWWAWTLYIVCATLASCHFFRTRRLNRENKMRMEMAEREKEHEQRINRMNMQFFANVSHEFRTPLTMISGPVGLLADSPRLKGNDLRLIGIVQHSINRMLRLVNQLMDFNKLENDTLRLKVQRMDIIPLLNQLCDIFLVNAEEKHVNLQKHGFEGSFLTWMDPDKLDKIVSNLLSNAMKFTPTGGHIDISLDACNGYVQLTVSDTGKGIPEDQLENVFKRYYQLNNQTKGTINYGTGIGLYYARRLAKLHHGTLTASNRADGHGAVFTLRLPMADDVYATGERTTQVEQQEQRYPLKTDKPVLAASLPDESEKPLILVVDDDADVVNYLRTILSTTFRVIYRFNAEDALKAMGEEAPSLVLCDVVMPGMNGYDFCRLVKDDPQLCHIPIILVTAKSTVENQIEGLENGADAYITKPFDPKLLLALIKSQLDNREKVRTLLNKSTDTNANTEEALSPQDQRFMSELYKIMEATIMEAELDVNHVALQLGMSRTKFYYKMKGLTGSTPSAFFRTYKLNRAAALLREGRHTVSEVSDMTGFSSLSFFSTSFKKQFGVSPSDFS